MVKGNKPVSLSPRIVVDDLETKRKLISISNKTGESIKDILIRLANEEREQINNEK